MLTDTITGLLLAFGALLVAFGEGYREANREVIRTRDRANSRAYREANRDKISERNRAYHEAHREEILARQRAARAAKRGKGGSGRS